MESAKQLLQNYLENIQKPNHVAALFAEDGAIELPYFASLGKEFKTQGPANIEKMISGLLKAAPDFRFKNIQYFIETPDQVFAEYNVDCIFNGKPYKQLYMGRLVAENGKIKLIREGMDMIAIQNSME